MHVGILLNNIGNNQIAYFAINHANNLHLTNSGHLIELYFENFSQPVTRPFCLINSIDKMILVRDTVIATDLTTLSYLKASTAKTKVLYLSDLEWIRRKIDVIQTIRNLNNQEIKIIARSKEHSEAIEIFCGRKPDFIVDDFNLQEIIKCLKN